MNTPYSIRKDPDILNLLSRLPKETGSSLTDTQLKHLKVAVGSGQYRNHKVDIRGTFPVPFFAFRVYFVFLMGRNLRDLSRQEINIALFAVFTLCLVFLMFSLLLGLTVIYLLKSLAGINLLEGYSLGIWDWFVGTLL